MKIMLPSTRNPARDHSTARRSSAFRLPPSALRLPPSAFESGGALVIVMITVCVLSVVAGSLLVTNVARYHTTFQSASWQESIVGAEAGVDLAVNELRKRVVNNPAASFATNWSAKDPATGKDYSNFGHAFPADNSPYTVATHSGEGNTAMQVRVFVDVPGSDTKPVPGNFAQPNDTSYISQLDNPALRDPDGVDRSHWWYRIKAVGIAGLSGPPRPNLSKSDNRLRRFSFFTDWRTGRAVSSPQVARMVEVVVRPRTSFRNALMADVQIDLGSNDVLIDSYDSTQGGYSATGNHGNLGNLATNGQLINANAATVNGDAMTNNGRTTDAQNVTGQQSTNFYQELPAVTAATLNPSWAAVPSGGSLMASTTYTANTDPSMPTLVRLNSIDLSGGTAAVVVKGPDSAASKDPSLPPTPSYIKFYVQGDISTGAGSSIRLQSGVNAIFYVTGNVNLQGGGIYNDSMLASRLMLNGVQPPRNTDGTFPARKITIATTQDFEGIIYAPNHDLDLALQAVAATKGTTTGGDVVGSLTKAQLKQISDLQKDLDKANKDYAKNMDDYRKSMDKYQKEHNYSDYVNAQQSLNNAKNNQILADQLTAQIASIQGTVTSVTPSQADDHARGYNGIYGGFVARTINVASKTHVHYDETLRTAGPVNHYEIVNWFEDSVSRDATAGAGTFWWAR